MNLVPLKVWLVLGAVVGLLVAFLFYRHSLIAYGEQIRDEAAAKAAAAQKFKDESDARGVVDDLRSQIANLTSVSEQHPASMRLCVPARPVSASTTAGRAQPGEPARPGNDTGVLPGTEAGPDIGQGVYDLALAGVLLAVYRERTVDWTLKQAE